jgi:hypothetical protein
MISERINGDWNHLAGKLKYKWRLLTDADLTVDARKRHRLSN